MNEKDFVSLCKKTVAQYANEHMDKSDGKQITEDDVFIVWMCKTRIARPWQVPLCSMVCTMS